MDQIAHPSIQQTPEFQELVRARGSLGITLTILMLAIYFGFIFLVAFDPKVMGTPVFGNITLGFPLGLFVIVSAIALTGIYVARANSTFDPLVAQVERNRH